MCWSNHHYRFTDLHFCKFCSNWWHSLTGVLSNQDRTVAPHGGQSVLSGTFRIKLVAFPSKHEGKSLKFRERQKKILSSLCSKSSQPRIPLCCVPKQQVCQKNHMNERHSSWFKHWHWRYEIWQINKIIYLDRGFSSPMLLIPKALGSPQSLWWRGIL